MSQTIIVSNEIYARLKILKQHLGPKMSFDSVINELLKRFCNTEKNTELFIKQTQHEFTRAIIQKFYLELMDHELVKTFVSEGDIVTINLLLSNGNWLRMDDLVHAKAEYMRLALENREKFEEEISRKKTRFLSKTDTSGSEHTTVGSAKDIISDGRKLEKSTRNTNVRRQKSKAK
jgi:predicted CopG family antitoxin